jgi:hypothetical protein
MPTAPEEDSTEASIVALGAFNSAIFQPQWFAAGNLIRREEADEAQVGIVHSEMTVFSTEWFKAEITSNRFSVLTTDPTKQLPLRDLVVGTFRILEHSPITAFGFNSNRKFAVATEEDWHAIGHHFAPKRSWGNVMTNPGLRLLVMEGKRPGSDSKNVSVRLEPSRASQNRCGVTLSVNEHFDLDATAAPEDRMRRFLGIVAEKFDGFLKYAREATQELLHQAERES